MKSLPDMDALYAFLKRHYKHSRFEGRNGPEWGPAYSKRLTLGYWEDLHHNRYGFISRHESATGEAIKFDRRLEILP